MDPNANTLGIFTEPVKQIGCPHCNAELDVSDFSVFEDIVCPACQKTIKVPGRLGNFILIDELGRGAMGCVYLAQDESLGRLVALKVMRREYGDDPKMLESLQKEAKAMATLNHRNVVSVYSFGREKGQPFFVMELLQGERLDAMMADGGLVDEVRLLEIGLDVAGGLEAAGNAGLTHGDIKPANILMNEAGVAKVVDFGLARFMDPDAEIEIWGTPYYIAPEKARKKGEDSRSDQYSLGATMFHALAGKPPFNGENPTKVVLAALKEETPNLQEIRDDLCPRTCAVIRRMMDKVPTKRYPTYASLRADLELALQEARAAAEARRRAEEEALAGAKKKKNTLIPIMSAVAALILVAVGAGVFIQVRRNQAAVSVSYPGRSLHEPFLRNVEDRNLRTAAEMLVKNNLPGFVESMGYASRNLPPEYVAQAWYRFFFAGMLLYAQQPDLAREQLEAIVNQDPILFDGGRPPAEDPRILARYALGEMSERDFQRDVRRGQLYFQHLGELAMGYQQLLAERPNDAARHFRAYGEFAVGGGNTWPYVLRAMAPALHQPRTPIEIPADLFNALAPGAEPAAAPEASAAPGSSAAPAVRSTPAAPAQPNPLGGMGVRDNQNRPLFQVGRMDKSQTRTGSTKPPSWSNIEGRSYYFLGSNEVLVETRGLNLQTERRFTLAAVLPLPASTDGGEPAVLIHGGSPIQVQTGALRFKGYLITAENGTLRIRIQNEATVLMDRTVRPPNIKPGSIQMITLSWEGWNPNGAPSNRLILGLDGETVATLELKPAEWPPVMIDQTVSFGRGAGTAKRFHFGRTGLTPLRAMVIDDVVSPADLFGEYRERIAAWNK